MRAVVRAHDARLRRFPTLAVLGDLVMSAWMLASIGLLAIGLSGLVAQAMNAALGPRFVGAIPGAARFTAATCRSWLADNPGAQRLADAAAAILETSGDAVRLRLLAGIAGLDLLVACHLRAATGPKAVLPDGFVPTVGVEPVRFPSPGLPGSRRTRA